MLAINNGMTQADPALATLQDGSALAAWQENGVIKTKHVRQ
jgi:hypothetical protein